MPKIVYILIGIILLTLTTTLTFHFLGIEFAAYGNYLLWLIALAIFYAILPSGDNSIF